MSKNVINLKKLFTNKKKRSMIIAVYSKLQFRNKILKVISDQKNPNLNKFL